MLSTAHIGHRIVVRYRLPPPPDGTPGAPRHTDVLGILESWTNGVLAVRRATGELVEIAERDVVAGKPIPPRPPRRTRPGTPVSGEQLAVITAAGWPAPEQVRLGEWILRAAGGFTGRANSALVVGSPGRPLDDALRTVCDFYAERGLPAMAQIIVDSPYEAEFERRGWTVAASAGHDLVLVQTADLGDVRRAGSEGTGRDDVILTGELTDEWYARYRGDGRPTPAARHVLTGAEHVRLAAIGHPPAAVGRGVVTGDWLGMSALAVDPAQRRRGLATAIVAALVDWASMLGARWAYVQVGAGNAAARAMYDRLGFRTDHAYRYYAAPSARLIASARG